MDFLEGLDWGAYSHFSHAASHQPAVLDAMKVVNRIGSYDGVPILLVMLAMFLYLMRGRTRAALVTLGAWGLAYVTVEGLRNVIDRDRPQSAWETVRDSFEMASSFPARSVFLFTFAVAVFVSALWDLTPRRGLRGLMVSVAAVLVVVLCLSQFYLALHFVTDVIAGLIGGLFFAILARALAGPSTPVGAPDNHP